MNDGGKGGVWGCGGGVGVSLPVWLGLALCGSRPSA